MSSKHALSVSHLPSRRIYISSLCIDWESSAGSGHIKSLKEQNDLLKSCLSAEGKTFTKIPIEALLQQAKLEQGLSQKKGM